MANSYLPLELTNKEIIIVWHVVVAEPQRMEENLEVAKAMEVVALVAVTG